MFLAAEVSGTDRQLAERQSQRKTLLALVVRHDRQQPATEPEKCHAPPKSPHVGGKRPRNTEVIEMRETIERSKAVLTFEVRRSPNGDPNVLEIYMDSAGLSVLAARLDSLRLRSEDHVHMFSETWGGHHLDEAKQATDSTLVHQVTIFLR
jgi:hypothetical protein